MSWIPVEERLPDRGHWLVSTAYGKCLEAFYTGKLWRPEMDSDHQLASIIAWQPLPAPYVKPRRFVVQELSINGYTTYDVEDTNREYGWRSCLKTTIPTREAAETIANVYEEAYR